MTPYLDDGDVQLYHGDVIDVLRQLPAGIAQTCVTSPPYWGLRDYGTGEWTGGDSDCDHAVRCDARVESSTLGGGKKTTGHQREGFGSECPRCGARRVDQQLGLEASPELYVERMVAVFREVWRVLRDDGTLWLNLGDSYASGSSGDRALGDQSNPAAGVRRFDRARARPPVPGLKPKDLVGIPWRVAFALQADGWYLRSDVVWAKPNPMPESVTDRPTKAHEYVFLLAKRPRYFYDADAVREPHESTRWGGRHSGPSADWKNGSRIRERDDRDHYPEAGRNLRSVWEVATEPFPEAHFATYPQALVRRCILAGTSERGECSACGAPWRREAERIETKAGEEYDSRMARAGVDFTPLNQPNRSGEQVPIRYNVSQSRRETTGWRPSCECEAPTRPQLALDPFIGSGTTALVARKHGRRCIGIDLSADYLKIAAGRLSQLSLLAGDSV